MKVLVRLTVVFDAYGVNPSGGAAADIARSAVVEYLEAIRTEQFRPRSQGMSGEADKVLILFMSADTITSENLP